MADGLSPLDLASLAHVWEAWARPKQIPPPTSWRSFGFVTGRGFGKTRANVELLIAEIMAGRARRVGIASFNMDETERTLIHGESGIIRCSPPWFRPTVIKGQVVFGNGAVITPYTPEVPAGPRGPEHDLFLLSEVASYPFTNRDEFFSNVRLGLRLGLGRMTFDTTPKRRNPIVRYLLERAERDPVRHIVVRGSTRENRDNLTADFVTELESEIGGTMRGAEELEGQFLDDAEGALFKQEWIDRARRDMPTTFKRRIIAVDPAISTRKGTDRTGLVELGLGVDDQIFVLADLTDKLSAETWGPMVIDRYTKNQCDCVVVERNRGGDLVVANLRAFARERGLRVDVVEADAVTRHAPGVVLVKETRASRGKDIRAEPVASLYERGRVSHVRGVDLTELEELACTWAPETGAFSPDALDALVHGVVELAGLARATRADGSAAVRGAAAMQATLSGQRQAPRVDVAKLLGGAGRGDRL